MRTSLTCFASMLLIASQIAIADQTGRGAQRGAPQRGAPPPAAPMPQVAAAGVRIVSAGFGANGSELRPFNESPGTVVVLAMQAPRGNGIVSIDNRGSQIETFADDKGQSLLEEGRIGSFPKIAEDGSAALVEVEVRGRPSAGAASVAVQGTIAATLAAGSKPTRVANVRLVEKQTFKIGTATLTIDAVTTDDDSTRVTLGLTRTLLNTIRDVRFFDAKNEPIESRRAGSGYMNESAQLELVAKTKDKTAAIEFEVWQNLRTVKAPFNVQVGFGFAAGPRSSGPADAPGPTARASEPAAAKPPAPPPVVSPGEGAQSVEAVVRQLQTSAVAGKGAQVLSVIYPTERVTYGQGVAMAMAFLPMASLGNEKAADALTKEIDALYAKHKLKPPFSREPEDIFKGVDLAAFVSDALVFIKSHAKPGQKPEDALPIPSGRPENVRITGDSALASLGGKDIKFSRLSGRWFIHLE